MLMRVWWKIPRNRSSKNKSLDSVRLLDTIDCCGRDARLADEAGVWQATAYFHGGWEDFLIMTLN